MQERLGWFPVPLLALVVFIIAASQVNIVLGSGLLLARLLVVYDVFLIIAGLLARCMAWLFKLPPFQSRASPMVTLNVYSHLMNPVNQESACRLEKTIFQGTGHKMVTNG